MRTRKPAETRKAEIVAMALRLADKLGPERLTTQAIADAVDMTQPGIFRHFPTKNDLWDAVAIRIGTMMEARWATAREAAETPNEAIGAVIGAQLRLIQSTPAIPAILFSRELHTKNKGLRQSFFKLLGRFHQLIATLVTDGIKAGAYRPELEADDAAFLIIGLVQGLAVRWSISGRTFDLPTEGARLLELQLNGFAATRTAAITKSGASS